MLNNFFDSSSYKNCYRKPYKNAHTTDIDECNIEEIKFSNLDEKKKFS